jgi:hypothetical protein
LMGRYACSRPMASTACSASPMLEPFPVQRDVKPWNANHGASMNNAHSSELSGLTGFL